MVKKRRGSSKVSKVPILPLVGVSIPFVHAAMQGNNSGGDIGSKLYGFAVDLGLSFGGFNVTNGLIQTNQLAIGYLPPILGAVGHKFFNVVGLNRMLARQKWIPFTL